MMTRNKTIKGFTFIELLVVVTIIAILTTVAAVSYTSTTKRSRDAKRLADLEQIRSALELCRAENGAYPANITSGVICGGETYLSPIPTDPKGDSYTYTYQSASRYQICTTLEDVSSCTTGSTNPCCM